MVEGVLVLALLAAAPGPAAETPPGTRDDPAAGAEGPPPFVEVATETGLDFVHFNGMSGELYFAEVMGAGGGFLDYDGDGDLDVYLVQGRMLGERPEAEATFPPRDPLPLTDRLYRNDLEVLADGTRRLRFTDVTPASGIAATGYGMGVASADYDGDGRPDLYVTNLGSNQMLRNRGDGTFEDVTAAAGTDDPRWSVPAAFFDYDGDGRLDLFVGNYVEFSIATHRPCYSPTGTRDYCGPLAFPPEPDRLFRNRGDGTFEDATKKAGLNAEYGGALGAVTADFNGDGRLDLYVGNDELPNQLWINRGDGSFVNEALLAGSAVNAEGNPEASMGIVAGDVDGDGATDLFMTHINRESNTLYLNDGRGLFRDQTRETGLGLPSWNYTGFGTALLDYDGDGRLDLFVANGAVRRLEELARQGDPYPVHQRNQLFRNLGDGRFEEVTAAAGPALALSEVSRGVAVGDVDDDGDPDLLVANNSGPARLLLNQVGNRRPWLGLRLVAGDPPRDQIGARVAVFRSGASALWRRCGTDGSYAAANDPRILVGLGDAPEVERVLVVWPDGTHEEFAPPPLGRYTTLRRGTGRTPGLKEDG